MERLEFVKKARAVATDYKTAYLKGGIGAPLSGALLERMRKQYPGFYTAEKIRTLEAMIGDTPVYGFDCVCFIKSILWGWKGDPNATYGGAVYKSGGVPDLTVEQLLGVCTDVSTEFSNEAILPGELLYMPGHVGIYLGDGVSVECTTKWQGGVLLSSPVGCTSKENLPKRAFTKHGKLPYLTESPQKVPENLPGTAETALPTLEKGNKSETVRAMQALLILRGFPPETGGTDGSFGAATKQAVLAYQRKKGLTESGLCDSATWKALLSL